ncbi:MAG: hypothetical protein GXO32_05965 [Crenarchaeota archaeon]|nr:hypothetical protein [Thermoproteota archaeon]
MGEIRGLWKRLPSISETLLYALLTKSLEDGIYRVEVPLDDEKSLRAWLEVSDGVVRSLYAKLADGSSTRALEGLENKYALLKLLLAEAKRALKISFAVPTRNWYRVSPEDLIYVFKSIKALYSSEGI